MLRLRTSRNNRGFPSGLFIRDGFCLNRRLQLQCDILQQFDGAEFGFVVQSGAASVAVGKHESYFLVGGGGSASAIEGDLPSFHMHDLRRCAGVGFRRALGVRRALQVHLDCAITNDVAAVFSVLAALRVDDVVTLAGGAKNGDDHGFEFREVAIFKVRRPRSIDGEDLAIPFYFGKGQAIGLPGDVLRGGSRRILSFDARLDATLHVDAGSDHRQEDGGADGPARVTRSLAAFHDFS